jgi:hypothetical protein
MMVSEEEVAYLPYDPLPESLEEDQVEVVVSSLEEAQVEDHMGALRLGGPSFQEEVPDQEVQSQVMEASYQVVVGAVGIEIFQGAIHQAVNLGLMRVLDKEVVVLEEEEAQEPFLGSPGLHKSSYCQYHQTE